MCPPFGSDETIMAYVMPLGWGHPPHQFIPVVSVVPMTEGEGVGVTVGTYNRDDLKSLLDDLCSPAIVVNDLPATHVGFRRACKRAPCVSLINWQRQGLLKNTVHVGTERRIDRLGFDVDELRQVISTSTTGRKAPVPRESA